jgi:heme exporter protein D
MTTLERIMLLFAVFGSALAIGHFGDYIWSLVGKL